MRSWLVCLWMNNRQFLSWIVRFKQAKVVLVVLGSTLITFIPVILV